MSLGPVMLDLNSLEISPEERELLRHPAVGGVILFTRNYHSPEQVTALISAIHALREPRLLVAVDHEGGRIQRFRDGFTVLPPVRLLGELYDTKRKRAKQLAQQCGFVMASELRAVGVDFSFAPVLDLDRGVSAVIGDRAFHSDPQIVADLAHSYMSGMQQAGMAATGKHFPGHGAVAADSHLAVPVDERHYEDIYAEDIVPFERMIHYGLAAVMPAHVIYPAVDEAPAGFSAFWLKDVLRSRLNFQGVIFSDDLSMEGASTAGGYAERARAALDAGCDMVLVCNQRAGAVEVIESLEGYSDPVAHLRLARMHGHGIWNSDALRQNVTWRQAVKALYALTDAGAGTLPLI
ncbi:MAG: beta-N-acetylhexosaminidase [Gammaproteobacteria bacterium]|nr:beta-N-acetylhexosaminidase [Gammaproteobacteria bacterium]